MTPSRPGRRLVLAGALAALTTACAAPRPSAAGRAVLAGGPPDGSFVKTARLLGDQMVEQGVVDQVSVLLTGGSADNLDLIASGAADLAPVLADSALDRPDLTAVARVQQVALHCLVREDSPVTTLEDLAGRSVGVGPPMSGTEATVDRLLRLAGLSEDRAPSRVVRSRHRDAAVSVAGGTMDATFWWGGDLAPEIAAVAAVRPLRALDLGALLEPADRSGADVYQLVRLPGGTGGQQDVETLAVPVHLVCRPTLPAATVAGVVDLVSRSGRLLVPQPSDGVQHFSPATLFDTSPVPLHPAAARRYQELHG